MSGRRAASNASHDQGAAHGTTVLPVQRQSTTKTVYLLLDDNTTRNEQEAMLIKEAGLTYGHSFWPLEKGPNPVPYHLGGKRQTPFVKQIMTEQHLFSPKILPDNFLHSLSYFMSSDLKDKFDKHTRKLKGSIYSDSVLGYLEFARNFWLLIEEQHYTAWMYDKVMDSDVLHESIKTMPHQSIKALLEVDRDLLNRCFQTRIFENNLLANDDWLTKEYIHEKYVETVQELAGMDSTNHFEPIMKIRKHVLQEVQIRAFLQMYTDMIYGDQFMYEQELKTRRPKVPEWLFQLMAKILHCNICVINEAHSSLKTYNAFSDISEFDLEHDVDSMSLSDDGADLHDGQKIQYQSFFSCSPGTEIVLMKLDEQRYIPTYLIGNGGHVRTNTWKPQTISQNHAKQWLETHTHHKLQFDLLCKFPIAALDTSVHNVALWTRKGRVYFDNLLQPPLRTQHHFPGLDNDLMVMMMDYVRIEDKWESIYHQIGSPKPELTEKRVREQQSAENIGLPDIYIWDTICWMRGEKRIRLDGTKGDFDGIEDVVTAGILSRADLEAYRDFPDMRDLEEALPELEHTIAKRQARSTSPTPEVPEWRTDFSKTDLHTKFHRVYSDATRSLKSDSTLEVERQKCKYVKSLILEILVRADLCSLKGMPGKPNTITIPMWIFHIIAEMINVPLMLVDCTVPTVFKRKQFSPPSHDRRLPDKLMDVEEPESQPPKRPSNLNPSAHEFKPSTKIVSTSVKGTLPRIKELTSNSNFNVYLTGISLV